MKHAVPYRLCESCRITSCTPMGALISTVADKDRYHHKCNTITLPPEPTADKLREWISEVKERVRNAFSFDSDYALAWISETERLDYDALGGPCKYPGGWIPTSLLLSGIASRRGPLGIR